MKSQLLIILVLFLTISCQNSQAIFQENGDDWITEGNAYWNFSKDELTGKVNDEVGFVMTKNTYKDFVLELEFEPDSTINSGIFIRCKNYELSAEDCYEVNIWDLHPNQGFRTGSIVTKQEPLAQVETIGKWNTYKIKNVKDHLEVWINGVLITNLKDDSLVEGYIGLQASGTGEISFRNVKIMPL
jgi:hypothetical protein